MCALTTFNISLRFQYKSKVKRSLEVNSRRHQLEGHCHSLKKKNIGSNTLVPSLTHVLSCSKGGPPRRRRTDGDPGLFKWSHWHSIGIGFSVSFLE